MRRRLQPTLQLAAYAGYSIERLLVLLDLKLHSRLSYEAQRPSASQHYLTDALDDLLAGRQVKVTHADSVGCIVNFPERGQKKI